MDIKKTVTELDSENFFNTSINTMDDAIGLARINRVERCIIFDFNAVLLLSFKDVFADVKYELDNTLFESHFNELLNQILTMKLDINSYVSYSKEIKNQTKHFSIKIEIISENEIKLYMICFEKLLETEQQLKLFSNAVGINLSVFTGCTWWYDFDQYRDKFFQSQSGPKVLGYPIKEDMIYVTKDFSIVREKAKGISPMYEESIQNEQKSFDKITANESDYFAGRTPVVTSDDEIIWVEAYGKCIIRYPDGSPRFIVALDIYMSDIYEEKTQLQLLTKLIDFGLIHSDVGVWYYQKHYKKGVYYFTESYQKLMSDSHLYKNETITDILNHQIALMVQNENHFESKLHEFRETHNSIFTKKINKYHLVIPNYKNDDTFQWIEVRGNVIERDKNGDVSLFVGINVDVTESYLRNQELERLRIQNERLQLAENLAVNARNIAVWHRNIPEQETFNYIYGNDNFAKKLGIPMYENGKVLLRDVFRTLVKDDSESSQQAKILMQTFKNLFRNQTSSFKRMLAKHRNLESGEILYIEHSAEISYKKDEYNSIIVAGVLIDVTENIVYRKKISFLANYDTLTNVYNRNYFENYIQNKLPSTYSVFIFDLDGLKLINDVFGHIKGDMVIKQLALFLKKVYHDELFISRIGGDEFVVLSKEIDYDIVTNKANELEHLIDLYNSNSEIEMNVSKGGKVVLNNEISFEKAFVQAENIMYRRKLNNRKSKKSKVLESILETLNAKTEETREHSERISELTVKTLEALNLQRSSELEDMKLLSRVHDIGKITIDDYILKKESSLTEDEFEIIKKHSEAGYKIIRNITDSDSVCNGVLFHHERWDGTGYPQGLSGENIPLFARILSIADSYDAMTNDRVYRKKMTHEEAINEIIRCSGTQFDPNLVTVFLEACFNIKR